MEVYDADVLARDDAFRQVVSTSASLQLASMTLMPGESTLLEEHADEEQFFIVLQGEAHFDVGEDGPAQRHYGLRAHGLGLVRRKTKHRVSCVGAVPLRMLTLYSEQRHAAGTRHERQADAEKEVDFVRPTLGPAPIPT